MKLPELNELDRPIRPSYLVYWLNARAKDPVFPITPKTRGAIVGTLNNMLKSNTVRRVVLGYLFKGGKVMSSKELSDGQLSALSEWIGWYKNEDTDGWEISPGFVVDVNLGDLVDESLAKFAKENNMDPDGMAVEAIKSGGEMLEK